MYEKNWKLMTKGELSRRLKDAKDSIEIVSKLR